jgi:hypothetical protein
MLPIVFLVVFILIIVFMVMNARKKDQGNQPGQ